jgi:hypothetical protein
MNGEFSGICGEIRHTRLVGGAVSTTRSEDINLAGTSTYRDQLMTKQKPVLTMEFVGLRQPSLQLAG